MAEQELNLFKFTAWRRFGEGSCGATCSSPMLWQYRFTTCQTTFTLMRSPQTVPFLRIARNTRPVLIVAAEVHRSNFSLAHRGIVQGAASSTHEVPVLKVSSLKHVADTCAASAK